MEQGRYWCWLLLTECTRSLCVRPHGLHTLTNFLIHLYRDPPLIVITTEPWRHTEEFGNAAIDTDALSFAKVGLRVPYA